MSPFGERLKELRKEKGLTQTQLAEAVGSQKETISRYENGGREPSNVFLLNVSEYFDTTIAYLLGASDIKHRQELSDEEAAAEADAEEQEAYDGMIRRYNDLSMEMQQLVRLTVSHAYKTDKAFGRLRSQQPEEKS